MIRAALLDLSPLRQALLFRRLWLGTSVSAFGGHMTAFGVLYYVWDSTHNAVMVGLVGLAVAVPQLVVALAGGAVVDCADRRTLLFRTTWAQFGTAATLAALAAAQASAWAVLALVAISSGLAAVAVPSRRTYVPALLPRHLLAAGLALTHMSFQVAMLLGPIAAAAVTAGWGVEICFAVHAASFFAALYGVAGLPRTGGATDGNTRSWRATLDGLRLTVKVPALGSALLTDLCATVLAMPVALFPVINEEKFGGDPKTLGLLLSTVAVGGVVASGLSGLITRRSRAGVVFLVCAATWGAALATAALAEPLALVLACIAVAGAADTWSVVSRGTVVQGVIPESYRGRISAIEYVIGSAGPHLGGFRAGLLASATTGGAALLIGGLSCMVGIAALATGSRSLRAFRVPRPNHET
jgi:MFS family permease